MRNYSNIYEDRWSEWRPFPDPKKGEYICAPFGPGVYQLRNIKIGEFILFGCGNNVAYRMSTLLPKPYGASGRNNNSKKMYVAENLSYVEYRTIYLLANEIGPKVSASPF